MGLSQEAKQLHELTADTWDVVSYDILKLALPEEEWKALYFLNDGKPAKIRVKPNPIFPDIRYVEGFYI